MKTSLIAAALAALLAPAAFAKPDKGDHGKPDAAGAKEHGKDQAEGAKSRAEEGKSKADDAKSKGEEAKEKGGEKAEEGAEHGRGKARSAEAHKANHERRLNRLNEALKVAEENKDEKAISRIKGMIEKENANFAKQAGKDEAKDAGKKADEAKGAAKDAVKDLPKPETK